jgi:hypothetical protein
LLETYRGEWTQYDAAKDKTGLQKPTPPDFGALAHEHNMIAGRTGLISQYELAELDVGKSVTRQRISVDQLMFTATTLFKPDISDYSSMFPEMKRTYFVFWKTDDQPDHIPKWEDPGVQAEVLRVWKLEEARKLALKRADELKAEAAASSGKSLKDLASVKKKKDVKILMPPEFSFLTQMYGMGRLQLGEVLGLEKVGTDFMQKVFSLSPSQADVATNQPKTEIYVVRAVEFTPYEELWSNFTSDADDWSIYALYSAQGMNEKTAGMVQMIGMEQNEVSQAWRDRVYADAGLKWEKPADQSSVPGQPAPAPSDED